MWSRRRWRYCGAQSEYRGKVVDDDEEEKGGDDDDDDEEEGGDYDNGKGGGGGGNTSWDQTNVSNAFFLAPTGALLVI